MGNILDWLRMLIHVMTNRPPLQAGEIGLVTGWAICPGYMYFLALLVEGRWPRYKEQFKAFMPGNLFLGIVFGTSTFLYAARTKASTTQAFFTSDFWNWAPAVAAAVIVLAMWIVDLLGTIKSPKGKGSSTAYSWAQLASWTKVWHNTIVYGAYGFLLIAVGIPGFSGASWDFISNNVARAILVLCLVKWLRYLGYDAKNPKHRTGHVGTFCLQWIWGFFIVSCTLALVVYYVH